MCVISHINVTLSLTCHIFHSIQSKFASRLYPREFDDGSQSQISDNRITNCASVHANVIIGIDVQGDTEGVSIGENIVDLNEDVGVDFFDQYIALRIRENVDNAGTGSTVTLSSNTFAQEQQILNVARRLRSTHTTEKNGLAHGEGRETEIEWENGGCPFANVPGMLA
jgi:hypothetical protein